MILFRKLHKWIGLAIGIQVAIWMLSGLTMGLLDHEQVQGHHNQAMPEVRPLAELAADIIDVATILNRLPTGTQVRDIRLHSLLGRPVYRVTTASEKSLFDAASGSRVEIDAPRARAIALEDYSGQGSVSAVASLEAPSMEVRRHAGNVWRVDFDDSDETSLYISGQDGAILERRNATWRLFDIFWMLHIMDYQGRENFNNALAIIFSLTAAWLSITGVLLLFESFSRNEFLALLPGDRWQKKVRLTVRAPHGEVIARIRASSGARVYDELARHDIVLPSNCGGGGTCGLCVVDLGPSAPETAADKEVIPDHKRQNGLRLSCQAHAIDGMSVVVPEEVLAAETYGCTVIATRLLTPSIREITLHVDQGGLDYVAGSFVHVVIPPHEIQYTNGPVKSDIERAWPEFDSSATSRTDEEIRRAYSLATSQEDGSGRIVLNVRFMPPPQDGNAPAGVGSSFMWNLSEGDALDVVGPLGDFHATDSESDMIFIGGGAGMAPLRAIIRSELRHRNSNRRIEFWYGARTCDELFYVDELNELEADHENFNWHAVLSEPGSKDAWEGLTGFVHLCVKQSVLDARESYSEFEYYVCGPPPMLAATRKMLDDYNVSNAQVFFDDFGI